MLHHRFNSTCLLDAHYNPRTEVANVRFRNSNRVYQWRINRACFFEWIASESAGAYFNNFIRGRVEYC